MSTTAHDERAETALLGNVLAAPDIAGPSLLALTVDDFWMTRTRVIAGVLLDMLRRGDQITPVTAAIEVNRRGLLRSGEDGSYLHTLYAAAWAPMTSPVLAEAIRAATRARRAAEAGIRLGQRLEQPDVDVDAAIAGHRADLDAVPPPLTDLVRDRPQTLTELLTERDSLTRYDWLVPGLMERLERVVITGSEGAGKSELLAQFACCVAAGIHPLTGLPFQVDRPLRVLYLDFENSKRQAFRRYDRISGIINDGYAPPVTGWQDNLFLESHTGGKSITGSGRAWWEATCEAVAPDLIVTGPAYKMGLGNPNDERDVLAFLLALDGLRERHDAALIIEAHAGHAVHAETGKRSMRPRGSSTWLGWPEVGLGIRRSDMDKGDQRPTHVDMVAWRSPRERRAWPRQLRNGLYGLLPWQPDDRDYRADDEETS